MRSGFLMNDGSGSAAALLVMLMTIRLLRGGAEGVTGQRVVVAALAGVLAEPDAAPGVLVVGDLRRGPAGLFSGGSGVDCSLLLPLVEYRLLPRVGSTCATCISTAT